MSERPSFNPEANQAHESIDAQLKRMQSVEVLDGKMEFTEVTPERLSTEVPIILAPGWGGKVAAAFKEGMRTYAEDGRRSITIEHPQTVKTSGERIPQEIAAEHRIEEVRKAAAFLEFLGKRGIEKVDVLAHSEGAIYTLIAATVAPERFRNIIISNPAGMLGKDSLFAFLARSVKSRGQPGAAFPGEKWQEPASEKKSGGVLGYILNNPREAIGDFAAIVKSDVYRLLRNLRKKGIRVAVIAAVEDNMFRMSDLQTAFGKGEEIDGFVSLRGGHTEILDHPKQYSRGALSLFKALERKR